MNALFGMVRQFFHLFIWWVMVAPWEQAIRVRMGRHVRLLGPGPHWRIPLIDKVYLQSVRRRLVSMPVQTLTSTDGTAITICGAIGYRITDLLKLYQTLHHAEGTLQTMAMGGIAKYVHTHSSKSATPAALVEEVAPLLDLQQYGLGDTELLLTTFAIIPAHRLILDSMWSSPGDKLDTNLVLGAPVPS